MVTFEEAGMMLDEACEALPEGIFKELNGGVNLLPDVKKDADGSIIMGLYHHDGMGRYIEIFYGSIRELYGDIPPEKFRERLTKTLHHELTHHVEGLAGDRTLEHWDEAQKALGDAGPIDTESVLFADDDDTALAPAAAALFALLAKDACPEVRCASAGLAQGGTVHPEAVRAAGNLGADISGYVPRQVSEALLAEYDAVMCMTLLQADELAERFPGLDEKILCLGETDILLPKLRVGWGSVMKRLKAEVGYLIEDLCTEDEETR